MPRPCDPCGQRSPSQRTMAKRCCVKCEEFLCDECDLGHRRSRLTKDHVTVGVALLREACHVIAARQLQKPTIGAKLLTKIGGSRMKDTMLKDPVSLKVSRVGDLVVSNRDDNLCIFSGIGTCKKLLDQRASYPVEDKLSVFGNRCASFTAEGYLAVATRSSVSVSGVVCAAVVRSLSGREIGACKVKVKGPEESRPHGIAVTNDNHVIVSDVERHCVYVFDSDFRFRCQFGRYGDGKRQLKSPFYLATYPTNSDIIVSDYGNHCIKAFTIGGRFRFRFGGVGKDAGRFVHPMGVCVDQFENIFVADRDNHRVQMFDRRGEHVSVVLEQTTIDGWDIRPQDIAVTPLSHLAVLLKGIEGVDFAEVRIYQLSCSLPPPEVRNLEEVIASIRAVRPQSGVIGLYRHNLTSATKHRNAREVTWREGSPLGSTTRRTFAENREDSGPKNRNVFRSEKPDTNSTLCLIL